MNQELYEKKEVIVSLLDNLRLYNATIGSYYKSVINSDFNYSVKLSNGRIELSEELVYDFEKNPAGVTHDRFRIAASKFIPNTPPVSENRIIEHQSNHVQEEPANKRKISSLAWIIMIVLVIVVVLFINQNSHKGGTNSLFPNSTTEKTPEELKQELLLKEQKNPSAYLKDSGTFRKNFFGEEVLRGTISNSATLANFKDIVLQVTWMSKTNTALKTEQYIVYEYVGAGKSVNYKIRANAPSATGDVAIGIISATPVN